jgi:hypothetical protein
MSETARGAIEELAYCKLMLHCRRFPSSAVFGLLLRRRGSSNSGDDGLDSASSSSSICDVLPLFHQAPLPSHIDLAMLQASALCHEQSLTLAGLYYAPADSSSSSLPSVVTRWATQIWQDSKTSVLLRVENDKVGHNSGSDSSNASLQSAVRTFGSNNDGKWGPKEKKQQIEPSKTTLEACQVHLQQRADKKLVDFSMHLDDVALNWLNPQILESSDEKKKDN